MVVDSAVNVHGGGLGFSQLARRCIMSMVYGNDVSMVLHLFRSCLGDPTRVVAYTRMYVHSWGARSRAG
jgi:hypothetical protein